MSVPLSPVQHGVAGSTVPAGVSAAVAQTDDVPDEDLVGAEACARLGIVPVDG
jgi:hypothetical protein